MSCRTILIVEDDTDIRESLQEILMLEGYNAITASNGKDGLEALKTVQTPCLILLDLMMPIMNGWEFLQVQRKDVMLATIPVVIVSAAGDRASSTPAHGYIKKPLEIESLMKVVRQYCA